MGPLGTELVPKLLPAQATHFGEVGGGFTADGDEGDAVEEPKAGGAAPFHGPGGVDGLAGGGVLEGNNFAERGDGVAGLSGLHAGDFDEGDVLGVVGGLGGGGDVIGVSLNSGSAWGCRADGDIGTEKRLESGPVGVDGGLAEFAGGLLDLFNIGGEKESNCGQSGGENQERDGHALEAVIESGVGNIEACPGAESDENDQRPGGVDGVGHISLNKGRRKVR